SPKKFPCPKKRWMMCLVERMLGRTLTVRKQTAPNATMGEHTSCKFRSDQQMNRCQLSTSVVIINVSSGGVRIDIC
ncbi:hypothetical protein KI387_016494, partial [Taxus chinensis]